MALGKLERTLYRSLIGLAKQFDAPVLKALICRNHGAPLPAGLDAVVAHFLGGPQASYYWPAPGRQQQRVLQAVRDAFRHPAFDAQVEDAFAGVRYLSGLLAVARKHKLVDGAGEQGGAASAAVAEQQQGAEEERPGTAAAQASSSSGGGGGGGGEWLQVAPAPGQGLVLVAHPCLLGSIFSRSVVLLCRHEAMEGSYGLILNKPLGSSLRQLHEKMQQLHAALGGGSGLGCSSGMLFGGGGGGLGAPRVEASGVSGLAIAGIGEGEGEEQEGGGNGDIPATRLVDLAQGGGEGSERSLAKVAALQAVLQQLALAQQQQQEGQRDEHDEYGNWIEAPFESEPEEEGEEEEEEEGEEEGELTWKDLNVSGSEWDSDSDEEGEKGVAGLGGNVSMIEVIRRAGDDDIGSLLRDALAGMRGGSEGSEAQLQLSDPDRDPSGVLAVLGEALRRAGGGTVVMMDAEGQVFTHHLPAGGYASAHEEGSGGEEGEEEEMLEGHVPADDGPAAVSDLLRRCLTPHDQLLLRAQQQAAWREQQQQQQQDVERTPWPQLGAASQVPATALAGQPGPAIPAAASKVQRFTAEVQRLIEDTSAAAQGEPAKPPWQDALQAVDSASNLFGTGSGPGSSSSSCGGSGSLASRGSDPAVAWPAGGGNAGGNASMLGQLMSLFADSPLFRSGPVPGVQVLHRRPRLGGQLVLPPWRTHGAAAPAPALGHLHAAELAAQEASGGLGQEDEALEGGLLVGADLNRAEALVEEGYLSAEDVRVCMGDCVWAAGQLEGEVAGGTWAVVEATPAFLNLFGTLATLASNLETNMEGGPSAAQAYEEGLWAKCLGSLGGEYAELARVPRGVWADLAELEV